MNRLHFAVCFIASSSIVACSAAPSDPSSDSETSSVKSAARPCIHDPSLEGRPPSTAVVQEIDFTGTATPETPASAPAQKLTLNIKGLGVRDCLAYDSCDTQIDGVTNLWGQVGWATSDRDSFNYGSDGTFIQFLTAWPNSSPITLYLNNAKTKLTGKFRPGLPGSTIYDIVLTAPKSVFRSACVEVPNCTQEGDGQYCGGPIDGEPNVLYQCASGTASVLEKCSGSCVYVFQDSQDECVAD